MKSEVITPDNSDWDLVEVAEVRLVQSGQLHAYAAKGKEEQIYLVRPEKVKAFLRLHRNVVRLTPELPNHFPAVNEDECRKMQQRLLEMAKHGPVRLEADLTNTNATIDAGVAQGCRFFTDGRDLFCAEPDNVEHFLRDYPNAKEVDVSTPEKLRKVRMELDRNRLH